MQTSFHRIHCRFIIHYYLLVKLYVFLTFVQLSNVAYGQRQSNIIPSAYDTLHVSFAEPVASESSTNSSIGTN